MEYDPVKIYLKEMSSVPLLTKAGEVEIAKNQVGKRQEEELRLFWPAVTDQKLIELGELMEKGNAPLAEITQDFGRRRHSKRTFYREERPLFHVTA